MKHNYYRFALTTCLLSHWEDGDDASWWWVEAHELNDIRVSRGVPSVFA